MHRGWRQRFTIFHHFTSIHRTAQFTITGVHHTTKYFIGRVTLFFANNYLTECRITVEFLHNFLDPDVIFSSHTMYFNTPTKDFTPIHLVTFSI